MATPVGSRLKPPQLAFASAVEQPPAGNDWVHELKFDGYRLAATLDDGAVHLTTRNQLDWTQRIPSSLVAAIAALPVGSAVLDGEVVAFTADGRSDFSTLQQLLGNGARGAGAAAKLHYQVFDLLLLDGNDLRGLPLLERKAALKELLESGSTNGGGPLRYTEHLAVDGQEMFAAACDLGLEGVVSKLAQSSYRPGRGREWLKAACLAADDFVIAGFTAPRGARQGFGALLLGEYGADGRLVYVGKVGSGFSAPVLAALTTRMTALERASSPFSTAVPPAAIDGGVTWLKPRLVAEVIYSERTADGYLRQARFKGLREDKEKEMTAASKDKGDDSASVLGVRISSPERVVYADQGVSKADLAQYYAAVAEELLRWARSRPLSLVRCPDGSDSQCFYQKHPGASFAADLPRVPIEELQGTEDYLYLETPADVVKLVQAGVLEFHAWGSKIDDLERPDQLVFDLDPAPDVAWAYTKKTAGDLRALLSELGLACFLRATGGKGLHVVVPLTPASDWETAKAFSKGVAEVLVAGDPKHLTTALSKSKRGGKLFIDYLRNARGATAICNFSTRSRAGAPVATPLRWDELPRLESASGHDINNIRRRLASLKSDPWAAFEKSRRPLTEVLAKGVER